MPMNFCRNCRRAGKNVRVCRKCKLPMIPVLDDEGELTEEFLLARGACCGAGCKHCPYEMACSALAGSRQFVIPVIM